MGTQAAGTWGDLGARYPLGHRWCFPKMTAQRSFAADVPVTVFGVGALLKVCVVAGQAPLFPSLSRATWSRLGLRINFYNISASSQQLGLLNGPLPEIGGHLALDLLDSNLATRARPMGVVMGRC